MKRKIFSSIFMAVFTIMIFGVFWLPDNITYIATPIKNKYTIFFYVYATISVYLIVILSQIALFNLAGKIFDYLQKD